MLRRQLQLVLVSLLLVLTACGDDVFSGVYQEESITDDSRTYAYQFTLYQFGEQVGGVVSFYELGDGTGNTINNPYRNLTACTFFGPIVRDGTAFDFTIENGPHDQRFDFSVTDLDSAGFVTDVYRDASSIEQATLTLASTTPEPVCASPAGDLEVSLPSFTYDEAHNLSITLVFSGYDRLPNGQPRVKRDQTASIEVDRVENEWATAVSFPLPEALPEGGLSDADDGYVQYGVAGFVLYNDGNQDRHFDEHDSADEVLALSSTKVVLYVADDPIALADWVLEALAPDAWAQEGYGVYSVNRSIDGSNAHIDNLVGPLEVLSLQLDVVDSETNPVVFPVLMPDD